MDNLNELTRKKWLPIAVILLVILASLIILSSFSKSRVDTAPATQPTPTPIQNTPLDSSASKTIQTSGFTAEQLKAIEEQSKTDEVVAKREVEIKTNYPWFIKLPLRGEKYFVYFEQNKATFVALLYPKTGDNVEEMKKEVIRRLKEDIKITDVEKYPFEWKITPE